MGVHRAGCRLWPAVAAALMAWGMGATMFGEGCQAQRLGGCETTEREYGLPALQDSLALGALDELMATGMGPKAGPACRALEVDTPFFAQIGAVKPLADDLWVSVAEQLTALLGEHGIRIAERSLLRHTTGTCFPPHHVDFRGVADSAAVKGLLEELPKNAWKELTLTGQRSERRLFVSAGTSLQLMETTIDLR